MTHVLVLLLALPIQTPEEETTAAEAVPCEECLVSASPPTPSFGGSFFDRPYLLGDWGGLRSSLADHGITWDVYSTQFYQGVVDGGLRDASRYGGRMDYLAHVDGEKAGLWRGFFVDLHGETLYGDSINGFTGALLPVSLGQAVPVLNDTITVLSGVKFTQALSENFVTFFGKINTLDTFNQPFTGGARGVNGFMNTGLLLPPVLARTVSYSTLGGGFAVLSEGQPVFSMMFLDTRNTPTTSGFEDFFGNGVTINTLGTLPITLGGKPGHQSLGVSYSSGRYAALDDLPYYIIGRLRGDFPVLPRETGSWAVYYMFDQALWVDPCDPTRSWGIFGNASISDGNPNPIRWAMNVGVGGSTPIASRPHDTFGIGYFCIGLSDYLVNLAPRLVPLEEEQGIELFYNVGVTPWCHITPDLQVINPIRTNVDTSVNLGLRMKIDF